MIKFFRHIRQRLLSEGKTGKYIKYGIGEIVLVVIGILIALQINNWNQTRLNRNFELTMLSEIKSSLELDLKNTQRYFKPRLERKSQGIQELLTMIASDKIYPDSVLLKSYNKMLISLTRSLDYNKGGYEGLKSVGLDKISNDSLRRELILLYEKYLPDLMLFYESRIADVSIKDYELQLHNSLWKRVQIQMSDKSNKIVSRPINNEMFLKQPELVDRIKIEQDVLNIVKFGIPRFENGTKRCIDLLNKELDN